VRDLDRNVPAVTDSRAFICGSTNARSFDVQLFAEIGLPEYSCPSELLDRLGDLGALLGDGLLAAGRISTFIMDRSSVPIR
jgi:hypothetical protein